MPGRQGTGYRKLRLWSWWFSDAYLIRYASGAFVMAHWDPAEGRRHYRINIELCRAKEGGLFWSSAVLFQWWRVVLFRPDVAQHSVSIVSKGRRLVLSFGFALPEWWWTFGRTIWG